MSAWVYAKQYFCLNKKTFQIICAGRQIRQQDKFHQYLRTLLYALDKEFQKAE